MPLANVPRFQVSPSENMVTVPRFPQVSQVSDERQECDRITEDAAQVSERAQGLHNLTRGTNERVRAVLRSDRATVARLMSLHQSMQEDYLGWF